MGRAEDCAKKEVSISKKTEISKIGVPTQTL
jgi:hypothetical protein